MSILNQFEENEITRSKHISTKSTGELTSVELMHAFEQLNILAYSPFTHPTTWAYNQLPDGKISNAAINEVMQLLNAREIRSGNDGSFVSALVQKAYDEGANHFVLRDDKRESWSSMASGLQGTKERPLDIQLDLRFGNHFAYVATHAKITITKGVFCSNPIKAHHCEFYSPDEKILRELTTKYNVDCRYFLQKDGKQMEIY